MTYRIAQDSQYLGNNYWKWRAWIDAEDSELDRIRAVVWLLHTTFPTPQVERTDRAKKFMLETAGWGTFLLRAQLGFQDGKSEILSHSLELEDPGEKTSSRPAGSPEPPKPLRVFLSYGSEESGIASDLKRGLEEFDVKVGDAYSITSGEPVKVAVERMIHQSDAVIGLVGGDVVSPFLISELKEASKAGKQVLALCKPSTKKRFGLPEGLIQYTVDLGAPDSAATVKSFLEQIKLGKGSLR